MLDSNGKAIWLVSKVYTMDSPEFSLCLLTGRGAVRLLRADEEMDRRKGHR